MNGAEEPRGILMKELYDAIKCVEHEGGAFCKITRERVDNIVFAHNVLQNQFSNFIETLAKLTMVFYINCVLTGILAVLAGVTLGWKIFTAIFHAG